MNDPIQTKKLYASFAELYPLDATPEGEAATKLALENPERFVMKPQREGGGICTLSIIVIVLLNTDTNAN